MMPRRAALILLTLIAASPLLVPGTPPAAAAAAQSPTAFINNLAAQALSTLNEKLSASAREQRFKTMLEENFDLPRISRFVLGRYWLSATDQEKQQFQKLFEAYVVRAYSNRFSQYSGQTVKVMGERREGADLAVVSSHILQPEDGPPVKVDWVVTNKNSDYRITDVSVEGVSMALTQRQEFASVIERNGGSVASLNKTIEDKLNSTATAQQ